MQIINWAEYWAFVGLLVTIYYTAIYLFVFRRKKKWISGAELRPAEKKEIEDKKEEPVAPTEGEEDLSPPWS